MSSAPTPEPNRKRKFAFNNCPTPPKKAPQIEQMVIGYVKPLPPPQKVKETLSFATDAPLLMAIDTETHALVPPGRRSSWWRTGAFGFQTTVGDEQLSSLRVVQVGWTIGSLGAHDVHTEVRLIKPDGFAVEPSATAKHGIKQDDAEANGVDISTALKDMFECAAEMHRKGGRICSHHLEFDAGLLGQEMEHCGFADMAASWAEIVREGVCTMDPGIGHWVRQQIGIGDKPRSIPMRLMDMVKAMTPASAGLLASHHDAGQDSRMHYLLACELISRAQLP